MQFGFLFRGVEKHPGVCEHTELSCEIHNEKGVLKLPNDFGITREKTNRREKHGSKAENQNQA